MLIFLKAAGPRQCLFGLNILHQKGLNDLTNDTDYIDFALD